MTRYLRKPFVVEAAQVPSKDVWLNHRKGNTVAISQSLLKFFSSGEAGKLTQLDMGIMVETQNGDILAEPGMWILADELSNFHVMSNDAFTAVYDELQELQL